MWIIVCLPHTAGRTRKIHCMSVHFSPFPALFLWLCWTVIHTHIAGLYEGEKEHVLLRKGWGEEQYKDRKWLGEVQPRWTTKPACAGVRVVAGGAGVQASTLASAMAYTILVFIHLQTIFPTLRSLPLFTLFLLIPGNLASFNFSLPAVDCWIRVRRVWLCVLSGKTVRVPVAPSSTSSPRTTHSWRAMKLPDMLCPVCKSGSLLQNTAPVTEGGMLQQPRLSTALVLITPGDTSSRFLPIFNIN